MFPVHFLGSHRLSAFKDFPYFSRILRDVKKKEHIADDTCYLSCSAKNQLVVNCVPCNTEIDVGQKHRALGYFKVHIQRPVHKRHYKDFMDKKNIESDNRIESATMIQNVEEIVNTTTIEGELPADKKIASIEQKWPGGFDFFPKLQPPCVLCKMCLKKFQLFPARGDVIANLHIHVDSAQHAKNAEKKVKQRSMLSFVKAKTA